MSFVCNLYSILKRLDFYDVVSWLKLPKTHSGISRLEEKRLGIPTLTKSGCFQAIFHVRLVMIGPSMFQLVMSSVSHFIT